MIEFGDPPAGPKGAEKREYIKKQFELFTQMDLTLIPRNTVNEIVEMMLQLAYIAGQSDQLERIVMRAEEKSKELKL